MGRRVSLCTLQPAFWRGGGARRAEVGTTQRTSHLKAPTMNIRLETASDAAPREALLDKAFGVKRFRKTSERLREGRLPAEGLAFTATDAKGKVIGTVRLWNIIAGSAGPSLLLGPLAIDAKARGAGLGKALMNHAINTARVLGYESILLVGDAPFYGKFGFSVEHTRPPRSCPLPRPRTCP
jgi:predicted N-acetyltransferase YhbS